MLFRSLRGRLLPRTCWIVVVMAPLHPEYGEAQVVVGVLQLTLADELRSTGKWGNAGSIGWRKIPFDSADCLVRL